jgi:5'-nucleotidase
VKRILLVLLAIGCTKPDRAITIIGTADLHGHVERLPLLGGYLQILRAKGPVVLVDGGDLFQGTIVSNRAQGAPVVRAMNALGYAASAFGNHEADYGVPAFQARKGEAAFVILGANVIDEKTGAPWIAPRKLIDVGGVRVGLTGGATQATPHTANPLNFRGLRFEPLAGPIAAQAQALRREGAEIVVVAVHAGGRCRDLAHPDDLSSCEADSEVFELARSLPPGLVDVIVAGHTHQAIAQRVNGIAVVQSWSKGEAFSRVDLVVGKRVKSSRILAPHKLLPNESYEGVHVEPDAAVAKTIADDLRTADAERERPLGPQVEERLWPSYEGESPLGNLLADLMHEAVPQADFGLQNGGGVRAEIAAGPLTYGEVYELSPFDNRLAVVTMRGATLRALLADNYGGRGGFLSLSGLHVKVHCTDGHPVVDAPIDDAHDYRVVTSDYLANGGDAFGRLVLPAPGTKVEILWDRPFIHDLAADLLAKRKTLHARDAFDRAHPRVELPGPRPACHPARL